MKKLSIGITTLGCKVNQYETSQIIANLKSFGFSIVSTKEKADCYLINTCTVTAKSDAKSRNIIRRCIKYSDEHTPIFVTGCYATTNETDIMEIGDNIYVITNDKKNQIPSLIAKTLSQIDIITTNKNITASKDSKFKTRAFLKIQDGCNNYCSFCKVPFARGKPTSTPINEILNITNDYLSSGFKEIVLTGINVGLYQYENHDLIKLINEILSLEGNFRLRLSSIEPIHLTPDFIEILNNEKFCKHLHIPIQSGSNRILDLMNRKYSIEEIIDKIDNLNKYVDGLQITTDIMAGFPSENDKDFEDSCLLIERINFLHCHIFTYSERENTKSILIKPKINKKIMDDRANILYNISENVKSKIYRLQIGKIKRVLIESINNDISTGYSDDWFRCNIKGNFTVTNEFVITKVIDFSKNEKFTGNIMDYILNCEVLR